MSDSTNDEKINRLVSLSETHPILPDEYIPWENKFLDTEIYIPEYLFSLNGCPLANELSKEQIVRLVKLEVTQVLATYAWSEAIGCLMFNEFLLRVTPTSSEGKYIVNMLIEEYRWSNGTTFGFRYTRTKSNARDLFNCTGGR